ncbi:protein tyrosine phosphatase domain-containing protein 1-like [Eriocheir sinensis]|uniref:protein tyrosine phosphatase domain-containing protein 1-like n=1 Tax=Eriocheir sinensis TaxID=95602 RepID=UPI0021CA9ED6|nr:protein tyrosine phosphatase domain-containing protein 1-like [Eriocheir sinensis]
MSTENVSEDTAELRPAGLSLGRREIVVHSNYSRLSEHLRQVTPTEIQCSVFCGGKTCKYDNPDYWPAEDTAIQGVYSHWVTDTILAMARPSTAVIQSRDLVGQFLRHDIRTVINLQLPGEHASCGGPLTEAGFSYDPAVFMENGIFYYNFGLRDYGEPTQGCILDMVKVMAFAASEGKVAVHCHAGLGRTGVLIACYLVYALRVRANDAIRYVRLKRPGAVQTTSQIMVVQEFEQFILPQLYVFSNREFIKDKRNPEFTLPQYLHRQRTVLHGYEARTLRNIPKLVYVVGERLLKLCGCEGSNAPPHLLTPLEISYALGTPSFTSFFLSAQYDHETRVSYSAPHSLMSPSLSASITSQRSGLLFTWLEHLKTPLLGVDALSYIVLASGRPEVCLRKLDKEVRYTLEYLVRFVARFQLFSRQQQEAVLRRLVASFTQQAVPVRGVLLPSGKGFNKLREGTLRKVMEFITGLFDLVYLESRSGSAVSVASNNTAYENRVTPPGQVVTPPPEDDGGTPVDS